MLFDLNEGVMYAQLFVYEYVTTDFCNMLLSMILMTLLTVGFITTVVLSEWFEERAEFFYNRLPEILIPLEMSILFLLTLYYGEDEKILIFMIVVDIFLIITYRKEFKGLRTWFHEKFGWLF